MSEASAGLRLMLGLIEDHELFGSEPGSAPAVFPVVHDGFERDQQLLEAAFRRAGGVLFTISPDQTEQDGEPAANLLDVIEATIAGEDGSRFPSKQARARSGPPDSCSSRKAPPTTCFWRCWCGFWSSELARHPLESGAPLRRRAPRQPAPPIALADARFIRFPRPCLDRSAPSFP